MILQVRHVFRKVASGRHRMEVGMCWDDVGIGFSYPTSFPLQNQKGWLLFINGFWLMFCFCLLFLKESANIIAHMMSCLFMSMIQKFSRERWHVIAFGQWLPKLLFFSFSYVSWRWCKKHWYPGVQDHSVNKRRPQKLFLFLNITSWDPGRDN